MSNRHAGAGWDGGFWKVECGLNEFVSGVSQQMVDGALVQAVRCSTGYGSATSCERRIVDAGVGYTGTFNDWDYVYYKADCPDTKVVVGVTIKPADGRVRSILCCNR